MKEFLSNTQILMNHVFWFRDELGVLPRKPHIGSAINFTDVQCRQADFLRELRNTVSAWVYAKAKGEAIVEERASLADGDRQNAYSHLVTTAFAKFRPGYPQGQFGELLLFNFLQHHFQAVPLLRKQPITTSPGLERFGADAIHYKFENDRHVFVLGEAKCYLSNYQFAPAFEASLASIQKTFHELPNELDLYVYDDFIDPSLESIAKDYKAGLLSNVRFELICLVAYNETVKITQDNEAAIKAHIRQTIEDRCSNLKRELFDQVEPSLLPRMNYIIFPFWKLDELLDEFALRVGSHGSQ